MYLWLLVVAGISHFALSVSWPCLSLSATVSPVPHRRKEVCSDRYNFNQCIVIKPWPIKAKIFREVLSGLDLFSQSQQSVSEFLL
jgi:hypothetical protein